MGANGRDRGVLVLNAGSSSIKLAVFHANAAPSLTASATEIGGDGTLSVGAERSPRHFATHREALEALLAALRARGQDLASFEVAAHRVVHGGQTLTETCVVTAEIRDRIAALSPLAPLHNPHAVALMDLLTLFAPELAQVAVFDTAFHASIPAAARRYALPEIDAVAEMTRYGFHGISYQGLVEALPRLSGAALPSRLLACHLGNGASLCAIRDGRSVATTMGYSPLSGLTMGTRTGDIDGNAVLDLAERVGIARARHILNQQSGLIGLGGASDMRALRASAASGDRRAAFALEHFAHWAVRHAGSMVAAMGGLDAVAFTGGIGEHDAEMRAAIMDGLAFTGLRHDAGVAGPALHAPSSPVTAWVVPAGEEASIARAARVVMEAA
ncbi:MAG: acetate/propionate family kinase [Pseudomonadota bacterium]